VEQSKQQVAALVNQSKAQVNEYVDRARHAAGEAGAMVNQRQAAGWLSSSSKARRQSRATTWVSALQAAKRLAPLWSKSKQQVAALVTRAGAGERVRRSQPARPPKR